MFKKALLAILVLLGAFSLYAQDEEIPWRKDITMLLVPREPVIIQIAQDISRRYPSLIVCYQKTGSSVSLFAWNGTGWVTVSPEDYANGTFFENRPLHMVVVEKEGQPAPEALTPEGFWCTSGNRLTSTDPRVVIHLLGRYFDFPYRYWMQFSKRYDYALEAINPGLINVFWWHYRGDQVMPAMKARDLEADMENWLFLDITPPAPVEPVMIEEEPVDLPPAEIPAEITQDDIDTVTAVMKNIETQPETIPAVETNKPIVEIDPFSADEIPAASVILPSVEK